MPVQPEAVRPLYAVPCGSLTTHSWSQDVRYEFTEKENSFLKYIKEIVAGGTFLNVNCCDMFHQR